MELFNVKVVKKKIPIDPRIPEFGPSHEDIARQMRINADCIMEEITEHVNRELKRFKDGMDKREG